MTIEQAAREIADLKARLALFERSSEENSALPQPVDVGMDAPQKNFRFANAHVGGSQAVVVTAAEREEEVFVPSLSTSEVSEEE